ncbi:flavin reductase [Micromonospora sp. ALFpr18c]|uniref:flavin reductase n=1 Tax=Micromonospora sp. ALFpr18c TaxID=1458665 RepID=UPI00124B1147|nr:flavin reductase [Micromonospora sp. ALFpr18c]KAB1946081.1 flavin reductase [Micromonospora sp. ALFpr18c]
MISEAPTTIHDARRADRERGRKAVDALDRRLDGQHTPRRPQWDCAGCGADWPCAPAQVRLGEAYGRDRIGLAMYCGALYAAAVNDLPVTTNGETWARFVSWVR